MTTINKTKKERKQSITGKKKIKKGKKEICKTENILQLCNSQYLAQGNPIIIRHLLLTISIFLTQPFHRIQNKRKPKPYRFISLLQTYTIWLAHITAFLSPYFHMNRRKESNKMYHSISNSRNICQQKVFCIIEQLHSF